MYKCWDWISDFYWNFGYYCFWVSALYLLERSSPTSIFPADATDATDASLKEFRGKPVMTIIQGEKPCLLKF